MTSSQKHHDSLRAAWLQVAELLHQAPPEARQELCQHLRRFNHDLGDRLGMIRTAEALLRREAQQGQPADEEILTIVRTAVNDLIELLHILQEFVQHAQET